jgi:hypothetical protein
VTLRDFELLQPGTLGITESVVQSQPVEIPMIRAQLNEHLLSGLGHAQVLVRVGWAGSSDAELPTSPRRS